MSKISFLPSFSEKMSLLKETIERSWIPANCLPPFFDPSFKKGVEDHQRRRTSKQIFAHAQQLLRCLVSLPLGFTGVRCKV